MRSRLIALATMFLAAGCTGGEGGGGGGIAWSDLGGFVSLYVDEGFGGDLYGTFIEDIDWPGDTPSKIKLDSASDKCKLDDFDGGSFDQPTVTYFDVGATISANGPDAADIVANRFVDVDGTYYEGYEATATSPGTYVISVSGAGDVAAGEIGSIVAPSAIDFIGNPVVVPGEPLELEFTNNTGADVVYIYLEHSIEDIYYTCSVEDDGSFTVPASVTEELDADAYVDIDSSSVDVVEVDGRKVILSASAF